MGLTRSVVFLLQTGFSERLENPTHSLKKLSAHLDSLHLFSGTFERNGTVFLLVFVAGMPKPAVTREQVETLLYSALPQANWCSFLTADQACFLPEQSANPELEPLLAKRREKGSRRSIRSVRSGLTRFFFFVSKEEAIRRDKALESYPFEALFYHLGTTDPFFKKKEELTSATDVQAQLSSLEATFRAEIQRLEARVRRLEAGSQLSPPTVSLTPTPVKRTPQPLTFSFRVAPVFLNDAYPTRQSMSGSRITLDEFQKALRPGAPPLEEVEPSKGYLFRYFKGYLYRDNAASGEQGQLVRALKEFLQGPVCPDGFSLTLPQIRVYREGPDLLFCATKDLFLSDYCQANGHPPVECFDSWSHFCATQELISPFLFEQLVYLQKQNLTHWRPNGQRWVPPLKRISIR